MGGAHRYLADAAIAGGTWSPDGKFVAYSTPNGDIDIINSDGTGAHKLASAGGAAYPLSWSPDGSTIRFSRDLRSLWEISSSGSNLHQLLAGWHPSEKKCCGRWSPDGEFFVFLAGSLGHDFPEGQIYALDERRGLFRHPAKEPIQLTSGPIEWSPPVFSKDGKKIFATGSTKEGRVGSPRPEIQSVSALPWRHFRRFDGILQRRPVRGVCYLPGWNFVESKPGWKRPRSTDQSAFSSRNRSPGHQTAPSSCSMRRLRKVRMFGSFHPRVAVRSGFFPRTAGRRQIQAGRRTGARLPFPRAN